MHHFPLKSQIQMTSDHIAKNMILFAIPVLLSSWLQLSFNLADFIVCGKFVSDKAVGAIGETGSLSALVVDLFTGLAVGVNVIVGQAFGEKNKEKAEKAIGTATLMALIFGLIIALVGAFCSRSLLTLMKCPEDIIDMSTTYLTIYLIGAPFLLLYNFGAAALRGMGDTLRPFLFLTIGGMMNVTLNLILVIPFKFGVEGLAIATLVSEVVSAFLTYLSLILHRQHFALFRFRNLRFFESETLSIIRVGIPAGIQSTMFDLSNVLIQSSINFFGTATISGDSAAARINSYVFFGADAFSQAGVAFVAANYGAKNKKGIKKSMKWALIYGIAMDVLMSILCIAFRYPLLKTIIKDESSIEVGNLSLIILLSTHSLMALVDILPGLERGLGQSILPAFVSVIGIAGIRILYVYTFFQLPEFHSMVYLYSAYPISWLITAIVHGICVIVVTKSKLHKIDEVLQTKNA